MKDPSFQRRYRVLRTDEKLGKTHIKDPKYSSFLLRSTPINRSKHRRRLSQRGLW